MLALFTLVLVALAMTTGPVLAQAAETKPKSDRYLLEGDTLHIGSYGEGKAPYPEDVVQPGALRAIAQHLKIDLKTEGVFWGDYCYFAGVTGEAFRFLDLMKLNGGGGKDTPPVERYANMSLSDSYRFAFDAAGLSADVYHKPKLPDKAALKKQIIASLAERQTPVIGMGFFGPPEPFLITGYDQGGEVLIGWSHFQNEKKNDASIGFEPTGQFRLENWYNAIDGVAIITGTKPRPSQEGIYREALRRGLKELQTTRGPTGPVGTAAMEKWAAHLERDADFANMTEEQWKKAHEQHSTTAGDLAERRALGDNFLELAQRVFPAVEQDLTIARSCFGGSHDTIYEIWETIANTGPFDPDIDKFMDVQHRKTMADLVRRLMALDQRASLALDRALKVIDGKEAGAEIPADDALDGNVRLAKAPTPADRQPAIFAPQNIAIINSMCMLQEFLGEPFGELNDAEKAQKNLAYPLWMGFTGSAFGMLHDGADRANLPLAFDALGYDYELWMGGELASRAEWPHRNWGWDDNLRRRIFWNLRDHKLPVLLFNCGPWPDWTMITQVQCRHAFMGYGGSNGEHYRPNEPLDDPKNALHEIHLMEDMKGRQTWTINMLGKRQSPKPSMDQLYAQAIKWGAKNMSEQRMAVLDAGGNEYLSNTAYQDWAKMMRTDALFPAADPATLKSRRTFVEGHEVELAERRFYGSIFLDLAATRLGRPNLKQAAEHFRNVNKLVEQIWAEIGGMEAPDGHLKYADKAVRNKIADLLLEIEREDAAAAKLLQ